jgi:hypothetical protein
MGGGCVLSLFVELFLIRYGFIVIFRGAEVQIGDGKTTFPCLTDCVAEFSLRTLQVCNCLPSFLISLVIT